MSEIVKHVCRPLKDDIDQKRMWCGHKAEQFEFYFQNLDHAASVALTNGRLLICKDCLDAATEVMDAHSEIIR